MTEMSETRRTTPLLGDGKQVVTERNESGSLVYSKHVTEWTVSVVLLHNVKSYFLF